MSTTTDLIERYAGSPVDYIPLDKIGSDLDEYAVTVGLDNDTVTVWTWEGFQYTTTLEPSIDRRFSMAKLGEIVSWLNRKESHETGDVTMPSRDLDGVGTFSWESGNDDKEAGQVQLYLLCGDERWFRLADLMLFVRALRQLGAFDAETLTPMFNRA